MVLPRRSHARPTRRRHGVSLATGTALLVGLVFCLVYALRPLSSSSLSSSSVSTLPSSPQSSSPALQHVAPGVLPLADLLTGNPPKWRDPKRDFDAEYQEVLEAVPGLRSTRRARIAFLIMAHGPTDVQLLKRSLPWLYSPLNFFLVSWACVLLRRGHTSHAFLCLASTSLIIVKFYENTSKRENTHIPVCVVLCSLIVVFHTVVVAPDDESSKGFRYSSSAPTGGVCIWRQACGWLEVAQQPLVPYILPCLLGIQSSTR